MIWGPEILREYLSPTVSLGKGFGSKGKQHHKHTASKTLSHNKDPTKYKEKSWNITKAAQTRHKYQPVHH
jgi:hypothetical protein